MRRIFALFVTLGLLSYSQPPAYAFGSGSITWKEAAAQISHEDPPLAKMIESQFIIDILGTRLMPNPMSKERTAPFTFLATRKSDRSRYRLDFDKSGDFEFTHRWKVTAQIIPPD